MQTTTEEIFLPVDNYPGYRVSNLGRVQSRLLKGGRHHPQEYNNTWHDLKGGKDGHGYRFVILLGKNKRRTAKVATLVLEAFVGPRPIGLEYECRHLDGKPANNRLDNLAWGTKKENAADCNRHNTRPRGIKHYMSRLKNSDILEIREMHSRGLTATYIAKKYNMSISSICRIINQQSWSHI